MAYTEDDVTSLLSKLQEMDLTTAEVEVLTEIVHAASGEDTEVEGFGHRNDVWKPMVESFVLPVGSNVIAGHVSKIRDAQKTGFQDGTDLF